MTKTQQQQSIQIGYNEKKKQYRKTVGTRLDQHGRPAACQFWLGRDPQEALRLYRELAGYWERVLKPAGEHWIAGHELRVRQVLKVQAQTAHAIRTRLAAEAEARLKPLVDAGWLPAEADAATPPTPAATAPRARTLATAAKQFLDAARARQVSGSTSSGASRA